MPRTSTQLLVVIVGNLVAERSVLYAIVSEIGANVGAIYVGANLGLLVKIRSNYTCQPQETSVLRHFFVSAKCPENPTSADAFVSEETPVFQSLVLKELIKGETFDLQPDAVRFCA